MPDAWVEERYRRAAALVEKLRNDTISLEECYEMEQWIADVNSGQLPSTSTTKLLVALATLSLREKIVTRDGRHRRRT